MVVDKLIVKRASVSAIVEATGGIGLGNSLPWPKLTGDFAFLKWVTLNQFSLANNTLEVEPVPETPPTIVLGRRTWESIGKRALPKRRNVIVSSQSDLGVECITLVTQAPGELVYFLGGTGVYKDAMELVDAVFLTKVAREDGAEIPADVFFPLQELKDGGFDNALDITEFVHAQLKLPIKLEGGKFVENGFSYRFYVFFKN